MRYTEVEGVYQRVEGRRYKQVAGTTELVLSQMYFDGFADGAPDEITVRIRPGRVVGRP